MALTIAEILRAINPNIGVVANVDGITYRVGVEDVNSDELLAALNLIRRIPVITSTTGTDTALATLNPGAAYKLLGIRIHVGSALAAAETLTVTLDATDGGAYDTVLYSRDMSVGDVRDLVIPFGNDEDFFQNGDQIVVALSANVGGDTWGCQTIHELV